MEDNAFLNTIDQGYVGHTNPQVQFTEDEYNDVPGWVIHKITKTALSQGLSFQQFIDKYNPSLDPRDWDSGAESGEQAWA